MAFRQILRLNFLLKFYLLVVNELCNSPSKEVDEQRWEDDGNGVHNVCHREDLRTLGSKTKTLFNGRKFHLIEKYQVDSEQTLSPKEGGDDEECVKCKGK